MTVKWPPDAHKVILNEKLRRKNIYYAVFLGSALGAVTGLTAANALTAGVGGKTNIILGLF